MQAGVEQAAEDINKHLGYKGEDKIKVLYNAPADSENIDEQVNILDEELARYPDVIAVASVAEDASAVQFDLAAENGIAVVAFDSRNNYQGIQCTCMTDNVAAAKEGARKMSEAIEEKGDSVDRTGFCFGNGKRANKGSDRRNYGKLSECEGCRDDLYGSV